MRKTALEKALETETPSGVRHLHCMRRGPSYATSYYWKLSTRSELCGTARCRLIVILDEVGALALFGAEVHEERERIARLDEPA